LTNNMGSLYLSQKKIPLGGSATSTGLRHPGKPSRSERPAVAPVLRSLADVYFLELRKRTRVSRRAIAIQEKSLPPDNIDLADTLASYALLLTRTKHKTEAAVMKARDREILARSPAARAAHQTVDVRDLDRSGRALRESGTA
jgi:hypothetical protein